jgi:glycosyltransferase involved in cell wall biosynthesis
MFEKCSILFVLSDVEMSDQLLAIVEKSFLHLPDVRVIFYGNPDAVLVKELASRSIVTEVIQPGRYFQKGIFFLKLIRCSVLQRPHTVIFSGQWASVVGIPIAFILKNRGRILIRHHSNFHHKLVMWKYYLIDFCLNLMSTKVVAVSQVVQDLLHNTEFVPLKKIRLIPNGIDIAKFAGWRNGRACETAATSSLKVGMISRQTRLKGIVYALLAFERYLEYDSTATFYLAGAEADDSARISEIANRLPSGSFIEVKATNEIDKFLGNLDVFLHVPTGPNVESFGLVYLESLLAGPQCVFTKSGVIHELPNISEYAQIVDYKSVGGILSALLKIKESSVSKDYYPIALLQEYALENMAKKYFSLISGRFETP